MNMKDMIQRMTDIEANAKVYLNESQQLAECPPDMAEGPMQQGAPVSMNVSLNASGMDHVADLISLMKNAGLNAKPAGDVIMPMRHDIEKFRAAMDDDPNIPGRDDVEGDVDLQQGIVGSALGGIGGALAGGALGAATGATGALGSAGASLGSKAGGALAKAMGKGMLGQMAGRAAGSSVGSAVGSAIPSAVGGAVGSEIGDRITSKEKEESVEEYSNEPNPEYQDHKYMTKDLSGGLNREKKAYAAAQDGDNAMAVEGSPAISPKYIKHLQLALRNKGPQLSRSETRQLQDILDKLDIANIKTIMNADIPHLSQMAKLYLRNKTPGGMKNYDESMAEAIKAQLYKALTEKKKPDDDGDGVPDWADKKPGEDDYAGKKKGSKPKKGVVPPQFKKK